MRRQTSGENRGFMTRAVALCRAFNEVRSKLGNQRKEAPGLFPFHYLEATHSPNLEDSAHAVYRGKIWTRRLILKGKVPFRNSGQILKMAPAWQDTSSLGEAAPNALRS
jgi:hypothetical protein